MTETIIRIYEGERLPDHIRVERILATEEVPTGAGTNTRRMLTLLVQSWRDEAEGFEKERDALLAERETLREALATVAAWDSRQAAGHGHIGVREFACAALEGASDE